MADQKEITVQALGRQGAGLGKLYDATTANLINVQLFALDAVEESLITSPCPKTDVSFKNVRSTKDRAKLLSVSASVSVSIMGGSVKMKGFGSYLDRSDSSEESTTIAGVVRARTVHKRLDLSNSRLWASRSLDDNQLNGLGATHVITAITYGGTLLGNFTETKSQANANTAIKGKFSLATMQSLGALGGVKGSAELNSDEAKKLQNYALEVRLIADFVDQNAEAPITAAQMLATIQRGLPNLSSAPEDVTKHGVPVELTLTPLSRFEGISTELKFRELAEEDLFHISHFYDDLVTLAQKRRSLSLEMSSNPSKPDKPFTKFFLSIAKSCEKRLEVVDQLRTRSQGALGTFLQNYRTQSDAGATVATFLSEFLPEYHDEEKLLREDIKHWNALRGMKQTADQQGFEMALVKDIGKSMDRGDKDSLVLVLIPEPVGQAGLLNTFRGTGDAIKVWRDHENQNEPGDTHGPPGTTLYFSFFADPSSDQALKALDGPNGAIAFALSAARNTSKAVYLFYGPAGTGSSGHKWRMVDQDGLGIVLNSQIKSKYVGETKNGLPHGSGTMKYVNGMMYTGNWLLGKRDGNGILQRKDRILIMAPFMEDNYMLPIIIEERQHAPSPDWQNTALVDVAVFDKAGVWVESAVFSVPTGPPPHRQVEKIALAFGWSSGERFSITPILGTLRESPEVVIANGKEIESGPYPAGHSDIWAWPEPEPQRVTDQFPFRKWFTAGGPPHDYRLKPVKVNAVRLT